jgi:hypothetical protein
LLTNGINIKILTVYYCQRISRLLLIREGVKFGMILVLIHSLITLGLIYVFNDINEEAFFKLVVLATFYKKL